MVMIVYQERTGRGIVAPQLPRREVPMSIEEIVIWIGFILLIIAGFLIARHKTRRNGGS